MRKAELILHRKIASEHKCLCGSDMQHTRGEWVCLRQFEKKEPNRIDIIIDGRVNLANKDVIQLLAQNRDDKVDLKDEIERLKKKFDGDSTMFDYPYIITKIETFERRLNL